MLPDKIEHCIVFMNYWDVSGVFWIFSKCTIEIPHLPADPSTIAILVNIILNNQVKIRSNSWVQSIMGTVKGTMHLYRVTQFCAGSCFLVLMGSQGVSFQCPERREGERHAPRGPLWRRSKQWRVTVYQRR